MDPILPFIFHLPPWTNHIASRLAAIQIPLAVSNNPFDAGGREWLEQASACRANGGEELTVGAERRRWVEELGEHRLAREATWRSPGEEGCSS
jgi:hypothetical protein